MSAGQGTALPPRSNPLPYNTCLVRLLVNGPRVTAYIKETIRYHINGMRMRVYMQKRQLWSDKVWSSIAFTVLVAHLKPLTFPHKFALPSKLTNGWLNTGRRINTGSSNCCLSCGQVDKTQEHILRCNHRNIRAKRYNCMIQLRATISTTKRIFDHVAIPQQSHRPVVNRRRDTNTGPRE